MPKFTPNQFGEVKEESEKSIDSRVVKLEANAETVVQQFHFGKIRRAGEGDYASVKAKYGALAATDAERAARNQKDRRFSLNSLLRDPLSVEEEERRVIEEKVRARVAAVADAAKAKAAEEGYQAGLKKGHEEAFARFREEAQDRIAHLESLLREADSAKEEIYRANERFLQELIYRVARMVMLKELSTDREYVLRLTRELVEKVGVRDNVRIRIHPDDAATVGMLKEGLERALGTMKNLNVEVSNQIRRGGCTVETEWNAIDASIETQLQGVYEALVGGSGGGDKPGGGQKGGQPGGETA